MITTSENDSWWFQSFHINNIQRISKINIWEEACGEPTIRWRNRTKWHWPAEECDSWSEPFSFLRRHCYLCIHVVAISSSSTYAASAWNMSKKLFEHCRTLRAKFECQISCVYLFLKQSQNDLAILKPLEQLKAGSTMWLSSRMPLLLKRQSMNGLVIISRAVYHFEFVPFLQENLPGARSVRGAGMLDRAVSGCLRLCPKKSPPETQYLIRLDREYIIIFNSGYRSNLSILLGRFFHWNLFHTNSFAWWISSRQVAWKWLQIASRAGSCTRRARGWLSLLWCLPNGCEPYCLGVMILSNLVESCNKFS